LTSSAWTRRCPYVGFSTAMRITSLRMAVAVGGRPGRRRLPDPGASDVRHAATLLELANGMTGTGAVTGPDASGAWQASLFDLEVGE
jgi:hypothetical protein